MTDSLPPEGPSASDRLGKRSSFDLYAEVTRQMTDLLEQGVVPWRSPILGQGKLSFPKNLNTGKAYRGVNVFLLALTAHIKGYESNYWLTFDQARGRGGNVRKGESSSMVVFWKPIEQTDPASGQKQKRFVLRYYRVFNVDQCDGIEKPDAKPYQPSEHKPVESAERIVDGYQGGPVIEHGGTQAYYRPSEDKVKLPPPTRFSSTEEYYSTLFHELSHSTGHHTRLKRGLEDVLRPFGSPDYGKEELIAEMSSAFLCAEAGIKPAVIDNQAAYISGWLGKLKNDKRLVIYAAGAATRSAEWILGRRDQVALGKSGNGGEGGGGGGGEGGDGGEEPTDIELQADPANSESSIALTGNTSPATQARSAPPDQAYLLYQAARDYRKRGFMPVPIPAGQKGPVLRGWQTLRMTAAQVPQFFSDAGNIGLLLGSPSGDLVDVDLDCPQARQLAPLYLPHTPAVTGRPSSPASHWWYRSPNVETRRHRDPTDQSSIVELRGTGCQTLVGPSVHTSGESYDMLVQEPARVDAAYLSQAVDLLAKAVVILRHPHIQSSSETKPAASSPFDPCPADRSIGPAEDGSIGQAEDSLLSRAAAYLDAMPPAISGSGGHNATYAAATALVHGFGLSQAQALHLLLGRYNPRCIPPWKEKDLLYKVAEAMSCKHDRPFGWLRDKTFKSKESASKTRKQEFAIKIG